MPNVASQGRTSGTDPVVAIATFLCVGWWAETGAWVPRDWALRPSYDTRVAIINAMYACGENVQKLMPVLLTEAVRRDRCAPPCS